MREFALTEDIALVTGGGTGIGLGIARALIQAGARVVLSSRNEDKLTQAVAQLGERAGYRVHDVTDFARSEAFVAQVEAEVGPISILVNNAGIHLKKPSEKVSAEEFRKVLDVHVLTRIIKILWKNRFDGMLVPDHTPKMSCDAPWHAGMAYAMGYMKALLDE